MAYYGFFLALAASLALTPLVRRLALRRKIVDYPDGVRKTHGAPTPLLGGWAVLGAVAVAAVLSLSSLLGGFLLTKHLIGILAGCLVLAVGGTLDDKYKLKPALQLLFPVLASLIVIVSGIGIHYVTNPFGGTIPLDGLKLRIFSLGGTPYFLTLPEDLFTFAWLMAMTYTTKLLDGLDGLVSGLCAIGATVLAILSLTAEVAQPELAVLSGIVAGAFAGFLFFNASPASIFLGEGGSTMAGFLLGSLAILAGGKIGVTLLVLAVPIMDAAWTIFRRLVLERRPVTSADTGHLHFRLVELGLSRAATVYLFWGFAAAFGWAGLLIKGGQKVWALVLLAALFVTVSFYLHLRSKRHASK